MMHIRLMDKKDTASVLDMMKLFYNSPAILVKSSEEVLLQDIQDCLSDLPFIEGYVFEEGEKLIGYSMVAKSYSTEYGGICLWIEDIYIEPEFQGKGIVNQFFSFLERNYGKTCVRLRLEVEANNQHAIKAYLKNGYKPLPYVQMTKELVP